MFLNLKFINFQIEVKVINNLSFGSKIKVTHKREIIIKFEKVGLEKMMLSLFLSKTKILLGKRLIFKNIKYKWGGKSFKGIDCSALVQIFLNFSNRYCPRDAKDQLKYFKKNIKLMNIKKNDIIYWKGHVAVSYF